MGGLEICAEGQGEACGKKRVLRLIETETRYDRNRWKRNVTGRSRIQKKAPKYRKGPTWRI